jgi:hypothetical protein
MRSKPLAKLSKKPFREDSKMTTKEKSFADARGVYRRSLLQAGAGLAGTALMPSLLRPAFAVGVSDQQPIGTWPAGQQGDTVFIGAAVPRTGAYSVQGEDELKGWQLAIEHINNGDPLMQKIAPKVQGPARQKSRSTGRRQRRQAKRGGAGGADLHQSEQNHADDGLNLERGRRRTQ